MSRLVGTRRWVGAACAAGVAVGVLAGATPASAAPAPNAVRLSDVSLDDTAHARVTFEGSVNVASFQQDGLLTHGLYQYAAWYRADGRAVIARRLLPGTDWQSVELDAFLDQNDSHNTISMAVSAADGRLHVALGTHGRSQLYLRSVAGLVDDGDAWGSTSFEPVRRTVPLSNRGTTATWTYPQFETVDGRLLLTYRDGSTDNGRQVLLRYDDNAQGTWTDLGRFTDSAGTYTSPYGTSTSRYAYLHGFAANPVTGDLEISFSWRERTSAWCSPSGLGNHDLGYASSPDGGLTWLDDAGTEIGRTGSADRISITDPHVVVPIEINRGLINQEAQTADSQGRVHVMTSQFTDADLAAIGGCHTSTYAQREQYATPFHHWRDATGEWHSVQLPFRSGSSGRTKLLFDVHDTAYLVLPDGRVAAATADTGWTDWQVVFADPDVDPLSELIVDRTRLRTEGVLSIAYLQVGDGVSSQFRVADIRTRPGQGNKAQPRSTAPATPPAPYAGSAVVYPLATASSSQPNYPAGLAVDGDPGSFWVSGGTVEGQGPQPTRPETLTVAFGRDDSVTRAIGSVTVTPRVGFGPRTLQLEALVGGVWQDLGSYSQANAAATYDVPDVVASQVRLVATSAYDGTRPPERARNVQVAELSTAP